MSPLPELQPQREDTISLLSAIVKVKEILIDNVSLSRETSHQGRNHTSATASSSLPAYTSDYATGSARATGFVPVIFVPVMAIILLILIGCVFGIMERCTKRKARARTRTKAKAKENKGTEKATATHDRQLQRLKPRRPRQAHIKLQSLPQRMESTTPIKRTTELHTPKSVAFPSDRPIRSSVGIRNNVRSEEQLPVYTRLDTCAVERHPSDQAVDTLDTGTTPAPRYTEREERRRSE